MNENKHTPEPWRVEIGEQPESIALLCTSGLAHFEIVSDSQLGDIHADARRIVACVNACSGISTNNLEDNLPVKELARRYNEALKQRDELLEALEKCRKELSAWMRDHGDDIATQEAVADARAAIASVKGEQ